MAVGELPELPVDRGERAIESLSIAVAGRREELGQSVGRHAIR
jgi:hypothetical protein